MINNWWVTRPKRKLNLIPETLAAIADVSLNQEWQRQRGVHLDFEAALEASQIKRVGERRDQRGGGGRTYVAWLASLGLLFRQESNGKLRLTLAGEAIMAGEPPVAVLKHQILRYQFPSSYSLSQGVKVSERFKIRPFRFLLRLLSDSRIEHLTKAEIGKVVIVESENETERCYKHVVERILAYRQDGDAVLDKDFVWKYPSSKGVNESKPFDNPLDVANTIQNWIEFTQLALRDEDGKLRIIPEKAEEVAAILADNAPLIDQPDRHEYFQRKYGVDPKHQKDTRSLDKTQTITDRMITEHKVRQAFIGEALRAPVAKITAALVDRIAELTGIKAANVEQTLRKFYPHGAIGSFMTEYYEMAFRGRDNAVDFEKATAELFSGVFGFETRHVGPIGLTPDVLLLSDESGYCGIIDNKAYSKYTISNDHRNRMITNYIGGLRNYYDGAFPLSFFAYIAGGFGANIDAQIADISRETSVHGSAVSVHNVIRLVERHGETAYSHAALRDLFSVDRQVLLGDIG
ncbi:MAG: restriction endonuclease [Planctomycetota bacterium]|jgi:hypothetical protein|nr:restriction endonuclease [Planctomycetota bacterium]